MLFTLLMIAFFCVIGLYCDMFKEVTYGSSLEEYITTRNPQNTYDVENLTKEFSKKNAEGFL